MSNGEAVLLGLFLGIFLTGVVAAILWASQGE